MAVCAGERACMRMSSRSMTPGCVHQPAGEPGLDQEARKASCMKSSHAVGFLQRLFVYGTAVTIKTKGIQTPSPEHNQLLFFGPLCHLRLFGETFLTSAVSNIDRSFQTDFQHLRKIQ